MATYSVKDDHSDVILTINPLTGVFDSEGEPVPNAEIINEVVSSDSGVVGVAPYPGNDMFRNLTFGHPGTCTLTLTYKWGTVIVKTVVDTYNVTAGDPVSASGGGMSPEGLTPI